MRGKPHDTPSFAYLVAIAALAALPACSSIAPEPGTSWQPGYATRHNLAALAENPADLDRPRQEAPRDAVRRDAVISLYAQSRQRPAADGTSAAKPQQ